MQLTLTCFKSTTETPEESVKYESWLSKHPRTTSMTLFCGVFVVYFERLYLVFLLLTLNK